MQNKIMLSSIDSHCASNFVSKELWMHQGAGPGCSAEHPDLVWAKKWEHIWVRTPGQISNWECSNNMILSTSQVTGGGPGKLQSKAMLDAKYVIITMYVYIYIYT